MSFKAKGNMIDHLRRHYAVKYVDQDLFSDLNRIIIGSLLIWDVIFV